jgi:DnaJ-class molecular chaperone
VLTRIYDAQVDYYKILKVTPQASDKEIKAAFYKLSQTYHPDLTNGRTTEKYQKISNAYSIIGHEPTKQVYD